MPIIAVILITIIAFIGGGILTNKVQHNPKIENAIKVLINTPTATPTPTRIPTQIPASEKECKLLGCDGSIGCPNNQGKYEGSCTWSTTVCVKTTDCENRNDSTPTTVLLPILVNTPIPTPTQTKTIIYTYPTITNTPIPTQDLRPRDSYGNLCSSYLSHCKYGCSIKDSDIDYRINTIRMHVDQLNGCKSVEGANCSVWENGLKTDLDSLIQYCGSDFLNHL